MARLRCDRITEGLRASEAVAVFTDAQGRRHYLRVERDFLWFESGIYLLPVGIVHADPISKCVLIELPQEAETGVNRLWVQPQQLDETAEVVA